MKTRAYEEHELYDKYKELENCKVFAIKKAFRKFYSVPLELQDLEYIAWKAFLETEEKYEINRGRKSYRSFYVDCLYWKAKDYCVKYSTNKHKTINLADKLKRELDYKSYIYETDEEKILDRLAVRAYVDMNSRNDKGQIAKLFMLSFSPTEICKEVKFSKTKLYRLMGEMKSDLKRMLHEPVSNEN